MEAGDRPLVDRILGFGEAPIYVNNSMASLPWAAGSGDLSLVKNVLAQDSFTGEEKNISGDRTLERSGSGEVFDFLIGRFKHREINPKLPGAARRGANRNAVNAHGQRPADLVQHPALRQLLQ